MIYLFSISGENTKELIEEYRHRQIIESLKEQRSSKCDRDNCFVTKRISEAVSK